MDANDTGKGVQPLDDLAETLGRLLKNTVFRLSLVGALLFGGSLLVAQLIVYDTIVSSEERRVEGGLRDELAELEYLFVQGVIRRSKKPGLMVPCLRSPIRRLC